MQAQWQQMIESAYSNRELLKESQYQEAVRAVIEEVDKGRLRVAVPSNNGWEVNQWVKQAILLYFGIQPMQTWTMEPFEFYDKMLLKKDYAGLGVRAVIEEVDKGRLRVAVPSNNGWEVNQWVKQAILLYLRAP